MVKALLAAPAATGSMNAGLAPVAGPQALGYYDGATRVSLY